MLHRWGPRVVCWDAEWIPDVAAGRRAYGASDAASDDDVRTLMWEKNGATAENPHPFLKLALSRFVCLSFVDVNIPSGVATLRSLSGEESGIVGPFCQAIGKRHPILVGYGTRGADWPLLIQRALVHRVRAELLADRDRFDYWHRYSPYQVDLREALGGWGSSVGTLNELCAALSVPCKDGMSGADVWRRWEEGDFDAVIGYCEADALRVYALFARCWEFGLGSDWPVRLPDEVLTRHPEFANLA